MTHKIDTITGKMAQRSRLTIDASPALLFRISALAGELSIKRNKRVTQREVVLEALAKAYPALSDQVEAELKPSAFERLTGLWQQMNTASKL